MKIIIGFLLVLLFPISIFAATIQFSVNTEMSLTGLDTTLYALADSEANEVTVSGTSLSATIPDGSTFNLGTASFTSLGVTPSGGSLDIVVDSSNVSSGYLSQWTEESATAALEVAHTVSAPLANTWYSVTVAGEHFGSYQTSASGVATFTYTGGYSAKTFVVAQDSSGPTSFSQVSPVNNAQLYNIQYPTFVWNASASPDLSSYQLYIDGALAETVSSGTTSVTVTSMVGGGTHTWFVRAVDSASNTTDTSTFTLEMVVPTASSAPAQSPVDVVDVSETEQLSPEVETISNVVKEDKPIAQDEAVEAVATVVAEVAEAIEVFIFNKEIRMGARSDEVVKLQDYLKSLDIFPGDVDSTGYFGKVTMTAVNKYQEQVMKITPCNCGVGPATLNFLNANATTSEPVAQTISNVVSSDIVFSQQLRMGTHGNEVVKLQDYLKSLDIFPGDVDSTGYFGKVTIDAVNKYQEQVMKIAPCNCGVGPATLNSLNSQ